MRAMKVSLLLAFLFCGQAMAGDEKVIWECRTSNDMEPVLHLVEWGSKSYVKFAHLRFGAHYLEDGDQHGWYWHNNNKGFYQFGMILGPDGKAWYHDFNAAVEGESSHPLDYFLCKHMG